MAMAVVRLIAEPSPDRLEAVRGLIGAVEWGRLLDLLAEQGLVPTLGGPLLDQPEIELPKQAVERIRAARARARQRGLFNHGITQGLTAALGRLEIPVVPLKGATLADTVYGDIGARESADIDLLVRVDDLDRAVAVTEEQGWREPELLRAAGRPRLHRELFHEKLPPLEVHWRVHWYEESFAPAALARAQPTADGWARLQPPDELAFLLLFLARDGFAGLRQTIDVAAWWAALGQPGETAAGLHAIADAHPELDRALIAAARHVEEVAGISPGGLVGDARLSRRQRAALRLANPWLAGGRQQIAADVSMVDGLLSPRGGTRAFVARQLLLPRWALVRRQPRLRAASRARLGAARLGHAARVLSRYALTARALVARRHA
jgi:Uncharacterised nucleotidyltransferase